MKEQLAELGCGSDLFSTSCDLILQGFVVVKTSKRDRKIVVSPRYSRVVLLSSRYVGGLHRDGAMAVLRGKDLSLGRKKLEKWLEDFDAGIHYKYLVVTDRRDAFQPRCQGYGRSGGRGILRRRHVQIILLFYVDM